MISLRILAAALAPISLAAGFEVETWADDPAIDNSVAISVDDRGNAYLTVAARRKQSSLDIRHHQDLVKKDLSLTTVEERRAWYHEHLTGKKWLPDRNGDGTRDWRDLTVQKDKLVRVTPGGSVHVIDEYFSEVTGIAAGVLAVGSDLFVAAEPDFYRYTDSDGDGLPDRAGRQLVATGMQVHMGQGGHNLSGVALGPDGRVYWSLGDKGHHVVTAEGATYHMPNAGAIFRCELDGTGVERYSTGERNAQELAFDAHGNLFSMDNDGDYPGEKERALYITEGSEHGWRLNWQWLGKQDFTKISGVPAYNPWMEEKLFLPHHETSAAYITPTLGNFGPGPCGFAANPGTALSPALAQHFFMTNQKGEVRTFEFEPKGAHFRFSEGERIKGGLNNTGLAIGPGGGLYAASYGAKKGAIYRFDVAEKERHPLREATATILASDEKRSDTKQLAAWLDHPDQRVRIKAQFELVRRDEWASHLVFIDALESGTTLGKLHAIWGIGQLARRNINALRLLVGAWESDEAEVLAQAAKVTGEVGSDRFYIDDLRSGLKHESPRVQFFSAIALGKVGDRASAPGLMRLLMRKGARDPYLFHAAVMGMKGTMTPLELSGTDITWHRNRTLRLGAVVALRKQGASEVERYLGDLDELVMLEAARAIHDDASIAKSVPALAPLLLQKRLASEPLMRRVINGAFRSGTGVDMVFLTKYLERGEGTPTLRRTALASILWWSAPPVLDAVEGRYRKHDKRDPAVANKAVTKLREVILADPELTEVLLNGVIVRGERAWLDRTGEHYASWGAGLQTRYLKALATVDHAGLNAAVTLALGSPHPEVREAARSHATKAGIPALDLLLAVLDDPKPAGQGKAVLELAKLDDDRAAAKLDALYAAFREGRAAPGWKLELWQAAKARGIDLPANADRLERGGDAKRGKKLVFEHAAAQCVRCHTIGDRRATAPIGIGPDLSEIATKLTRAQLVSAMINPSQDIADGYGTVLLETKAGESISGTLGERSEHGWTINMADGSVRIIAAGDVKTHTLTSVMPPMTALMKPAEIRDVISYLATLKKRDR